MGRNGHRRVASIIKESREEPEEGPQDALKEARVAESRGHCSHLLVVHGRFQPRYEEGEAVSKLR